MKVIYTIMILLLRARQGSTNCEIDLKSGEICLIYDFVSGKISKGHVIPLTNCTNLDAQYLGKIWGINLNNHKCVQLYDLQNCIGKSIRLTPRSHSTDDLRGWKFSEKTQSVGICQESCIPDAASQPINYLKPDENTHSFNISFYTSWRHSGKMFSLQVSGCTRVKQNNWNERYKSLKVPENACILAFMGNYSEDVEVKKSNPCLVRDNNSVLELYDGGPLGELGDWYTNEKEYITAVAPCQCNYVRCPDCPNFETKGPHIILLDDKSNYVKIQLNFTGCKDFASDLRLKEWEGQAVGIFVGNGTCVQVYKKRNCSDSSYTTLKTSEADLPFGLSREIRSIRVCPKDQKNEEAFKSNYLIPILSVGGVACGVLASFIVYMQRLMKRKLRKMLSEKEIEDFLQGLRLGPVDATEEQNQDNANNVREFEIETDIDSQECNFEALALSRPYNYELEIPQTDLQYDSKNPIGEGQYGHVFQGTLLREDKTLPVAIKTTKPFAAVQYLRALLMEVKVLMYVGQHPNVVTLVGCCTGKLRQGELLIVMELCELGSLESHLKANRAAFVNLVKNWEIHFDELGPHSECVKSSDNNGDYCNNLHPTSDSAVCEHEKQNMDFNVQQLISWSIQIAEGMQYLAAKKVIHGDLSARNILLSTNNDAKISDFGLARKLYSYEQYIRNGEDALPWRWLALESLKNMEFSTASDIWGYGILLWEIFTLSERPYPGIPFWSADFITNLEEGLRPTAPTFATREIYEIMCSCWYEDPTSRPSFSVINSCLQEVRNDCLQKIKAAEYKIIHYV